MSLWLTFCSRDLYSLHFLLVQIVTSKSSNVIVLPQHLQTHLNWTTICFCLLSRCPYLPDPSIWTRRSPSSVDWFAAHPSGFSSARDLVSNSRAGAWISSCFCSSGPTNEINCSEGRLNFPTRSHRSSVQRISAETQTNWRGLPYLCRCSCYTLGIPASVQVRGRSNQSHLKTLREAESSPSQNHRRDQTTSAFICIQRHWAEVSIH